MLIPVIKLVCLHFYHGLIGTQYFYLILFYSSFFHIWTRIEKHRHRNKGDLVGAFDFISQNKGDR